MHKLFILFIEQWGLNFCMNRCTESVQFSPILGCWTYGFVGVYCRSC